MKLSPQTRKQWQRFRSIRRGYWSALLLGVLLLVGLLVLLVGCSGGSTRTPTPSPVPVASSGAGLPFAAEPPDDWGGDTVELGALPPEVLETLRLVAAGGPYPYRQDDGVFGNREGLLPDRPSGTYREYTVETPGSPDRGARRLVIADGHDVYYTDDHYASFRFVMP